MKNAKENEIEYDEMTAEIRKIFEKIIVEHVTTSELRDLYRKQFNEALLEVAKKAYEIGANDVIESHNLLKTKGLI